MRLLLVYPSGIRSIVVFYELALFHLLTTKTWAIVAESLELLYLGLHAGNCIDQDQTTKPTKMEGRQDDPHPQI